MGPSLGLLPSWFRFYELLENLGLREKSLRERRRKFTKKRDFQKAAKFEQIGRVTYFVFSNCRLWTIFVYPKCLLQN